MAVFEQLPARHVGHDLLGDLAEELWRDLQSPRAAVAPGVRVEESEQPPEARIPAGMRCGRHEDEPMAPASHCLGSSVALATVTDGAFAVYRQGEAVGLVDDRKVPIARGRVKRLACPFGTQEIAAHDHTIMLVPWVLGQGRIELRRAEPHEVELEALRQLSHPLRLQVCRGDHQDAIASPAQDQLLHIEARHDRFAGTRIIGEQEP